MKKQIALNEATIVLPPSPTASERNFGNELRHYLKQTFDILLPITSEPETSGGKILIGHASGVPLSGETDYAAVESDGTFFLTAGNLFGYEALRERFPELIQPVHTTDGRILPSVARGLSCFGSVADAIPGKAESDLRILYYNIYGNPSETYNKSLRQALQTELALSHHVDILGLQEYSNWSRKNGFSELLEKAGYCEVGVGELPVNYTPIFYRPGRLTLLDAGYLLYEGKNDANSKSVVWALFSDKATGKRFVAANTHYWWMHDEEGNENRIGDSRQLLALIRSVSKKHGEVPFIVGGDFNCVFHSEPISLLLSSGLSAAWDEAAEKNDCGGHHAYPTYDPEHEVFTAWGSPKAPYRTGWSIDHVFFCGEMKISRFRTLTDRISLICSDHCPVLVDIAI